MTMLMTQQALCATLEFTLAQALKLNLNNTQSLSSLTGDTLTIVLSELGFPISFNATQDSILVSSLMPDNQCMIDTSLATLYALKKEQQLTELIKQDKLDIRGDIKIAQKYAAFFESMEIDLASELAKHIGDIPVHQLEKIHRLLKKKMKFVQEQVSADATEWLVHEKRLVVTHGQISRFNQQVSALVGELDQVEKKIARVAEQITQRNN